MLTDKSARMSLLTSVFFTHSLTVAGEQDRVQGQVFYVVIQNRAYHTLTDFRPKLVRRFACHRSHFSRVEVSRQIHCGSESQRLNNPNISVFMAIRLRLQNDD